MGEIFGSDGNQRTFEILEEGKKTKKVANLNVALLELKEPNSALKFSCSCSHVDKKDFFGKSDPYVYLFVCVLCLCFMFVYFVFYVCLCVFLCLFVCLLVCLCLFLFKKSTEKEIN
jgi:hypothetical protein